jgi:hypothetical protein
MDDWWAVCFDGRTGGLRVPELQRALWGLSVWMKQDHGTLQPNYGSVLYMVDTPVVSSQLSLGELGNVWADLFVNGASYAVERPGANLLPNSEWFHLHLQVSF